MQQQQQGGNQTPETAQYMQQAKDMYDKIMQYVRAVSAWETVWRQTWSFFCVMNYF